MNEFFEAVLSPIGALAGGAQAAFDRARLRVEEEKQEAIKRRLAELEQQKHLAQNHQLPGAQFGIPEQIELAQMYQKADLDPVAIEKARLFRENVSQITNPAALVNIAQGKEYKPVSQSGGVFFNPYDTKNPLLKTTDKYQAETATAKLGTEKAKAQKREAQAKANLAEERTRLFNINIAKITDPLLQLDAAQDKSVFEAKEAEIEGKDGTVHKGMAVITPRGTYEAQTIVDAVTKEPLKIPKESTKGKKSPEMLKAQELVDAKVEPDLPSALQRIYSSRQDTPEQTWSKIVRSNTKNSLTGKPYKAEQILTNSIQQWTMENRGQPFPDNIVETINLIDMGTSEKQKILDQVSRYNKAFKTEPTKQPDVMTSLPTVPATIAPTRPPIPTSAPVPPPPLPEPELPPEQPLTPIAIQGAWTAIQQGESPQAVQQALTKEGFDTSAESVNRLAIDAINQGVPAEEIQQYLSLIGLNWTPPQASP